MKNLQLIAVTVLSGIAVCYSSTGSAACTQIDGAGTWNVYMTIPSGWVFCPFTVSNTGVVAPNSRCTYWNGNVRTVVSGNLVVAASCAASAKVTLSGGVVTTFNHMTFSRDKYQFSGVGSDNFGIRFTYNGVKL